MARDREKRVRRRALERHGKDVTHTTYSQSGTDSYGDPTWSSSTATVTARVDRMRRPVHVRNEAGEEVDADVRVYVKDSVTVTDIDAGDGRPDEFTADGTDYKVLRADDQDNGLIACDCVRK